MKKKERKVSLYLSKLKFEAFGKLSKGRWKIKKPQWVGGLGGIYNHIPKAFRFEVFWTREAETLPVSLLLSMLRILSMWDPLLISFVQNEKEISMHDAL